MHKDYPSSDVGRQERQRQLISSAQRQAAEFARAQSARGSAFGKSSAAARRISDSSQSGPAGIAWLIGYDVAGAIYRGGQGVVYEAVQRSTGRRVAVKVIKEGPFADAAERSRFEREVRILAQLNHPNIVAIHDSGHVSGHDYFVMDYIDGRPLDEYVRQIDSVVRSPDTTRRAPWSSDTSRSSDRSSLRDKLSLFVTICDAVNAAHVRGIIHRDLKPGNIRIDPVGAPHVLDFGLAKVEADDSSAVTMTGQFVGSLPWASPESAAGQHDRIDIRSDVYSLGVVLYQMLTGQFPYRVTGPIREVMNTIALALPTPPSRHATAVDGEIETIVMKCLAKEPERRYQSAGELAADVRRYLAGETIEAKRDSRLYVLRKALRRHWAAASIAAAFVVVVCAASVISLTQWRAAAAERDRAEAQSANAEAVNEFMRSIFGKASAYQTTEHDVTVRQALDAAARDVPAYAHGKPEVEAAVHAALAESYFGAGRPGEAEEQAKTALAIRVRLFGREHASVANELGMISLCRLMSGDNVEAERLAREAVEICRRVHPEDHIDTGVALECLAKPLHNLGRRAESEAASREALAIFQRLTGPESSESARAMMNLASSLQHRPDKGDEIVKLISGSVEINKRLFGPKHYLVARGLREMADHLNMQGEFDAAEKAYREAIALATEAFGPEHPDVLVDKGNLAFMLNSQWRLDESAALDREVLEAERKVFGSESHNVYHSLGSLGDVLFRKGDHASALRYYQEALDLGNKFGDVGTVAIRSIRVRIADILLEQDRDAEAETLLRQMLTEKDESGVLGAAFMYQAQSLMGAVLMRRGDLAAAEPLLIEGANGLLPAKGNPVHMRNAVNRLIQLYEQWDRSQPGAGYAEKAAAWREKLAGIPTTKPAASAPAPAAEAAAAPTP